MIYGDAAYFWPEQEADEEYYDTLWNKVSELDDTQFLEYCEEFFPPHVDLSAPREELEEGLVELIAEHENRYQETVI